MENMVCQFKRSYPSSGISSRNIYLDMIKGALVLVMLIYHCASVSKFQVLLGLKSHIHFIHSAFLTMTGFLCGYHYYANAQTHPSKVRKRLLTRAGKIFIIFLSGNVPFYFLGFRNYEWSNLVAQPNLFTIVYEFLIRVPGELIAFEILYIIAVFLTIVSVIIPYRNLKVVAGLMALSPLFIPGQPIFFIAFGFSGLLAGILTQEGNLSFIYQYIRRFLCFFPFLLFVIRFAGSLHYGKTPFGDLGKILFLQTETIIWFCTFTWSIDNIRSVWIKKQIILLGKYTLPAYIFQMFCARLSYFLLSHIGLKNFTYYGVSLIIVTISTWVVIFFINRIRKLYPWIDTTYRILFN